MICVAAFLRTCRNPFESKPCCDHPSQARFSIRMALRLRGQSDGVPHKARSVPYCRAHGRARFSSSSIRPFELLWPCFDVPPFAPCPGQANVLYRERQALTFREPCRCRSIMTHSMSGSQGKRHRISLQNTGFHPMAKAFFEDRVPISQNGRQIRHEHPVARTQRTDLENKSSSPPVRQ